MVDIASTAPVYFCHGLPGSPRDAELLPSDAQAPALLAAADPIAQFDRFAQHVQRPVHVAGFSIGVRIVCEIAALLGPAALRRLAAAQSLAARIAPRLMLGALFAKSGAQDRSFAAAHGAVLRRGLRHSLQEHRPAYVAHLLAYVADWSPCLAQITCEADIFHGTSDSWAPAAMGQALAGAIPKAALHLSDTEHYSTFTQVRL